MFLTQALVNLRPGAKFNCSVNSQNSNVPIKLEWLSQDIDPPTQEEIDEEITRLQIEYNSKRYQRSRQLEYPPLAELADALYWQAQGDETKMTAYLAAVDAVKARYPKE